ncbi:TetR/AcrR family transcriptional regulator [Nocardioides campestrisoli]|uniref:TetR/AcrR family transcriptional regulator n=1 Tax=Nocardioides campestrisoli TaxID=2736757 RepID=UPI0015E71443|nr:TetR/AcrR family transcriptional regulator [Nocardioides campestrisoli]
MPRIQAPTVAEHRRRQERALLDAARALLAETPEAPTLGAVGERAGMARSSVYQYFASRDDLLAAVVADVFPEWAGQVRARVESAGGPGERVWAYVCANVELFASSEQSVARALTAVVEPHLLRAPMQAFHAELQVPLLTALTDLGEPRPRQVAELVDSMVVQVSRSLGSGGGGPEDAPRDQGEALALLRRLLAGYLGLSPDLPADPAGDGPGPAPRSR